MNLDPAPLPRGHLCEPPSVTRPRDEWMGQFGRATHRTRLIRVDVHVLRKGQIQW
jgi:hypothetical protein